MSGGVSLRQLAREVHTQKEQFLLNKLSPSSQGACRGAYSTRRLRAGYTGPVVRVRRASDNAEHEFFADENSQMTTARGMQGTTLATWLWGTTGYLAKWYDQSGNSRDLVQADVNAQPTITSTLTYPPTFLYGSSTNVYPSLYGCGTYTASASSTNSTDYAWRAFNGSTNSPWFSAVTYDTAGTYTGSVATTVGGVSYTGEWIQLSSPVPIPLTGFSLNFCIYGTAPKSYVVAGSADGTTWTSVYTSANTGFALDTRYYIQIPGAVQTFNHFRVIMRSLIGPFGSSRSGSLLDWQLFGHCAPEPFVTFDGSADYFATTNVPLTARDDTYSYMCRWSYANWLSTSTLVEQNSATVTSDKRAALVRTNRTLGFCWPRQRCTHSSSRYISKRGLQDSHDMQPHPRHP